VGLEGATGLKGEMGFSGVGDTGLQGEEGPNCNPEFISDNLTFWAKVVSSDTLSIEHLRVCN
jgi:hypothetical protein